MHVLVQGWVAQQRRRVGPAGHQRRLGRRRLQAAYPKVGQVDLHCVDGLCGQHGDAVPRALAVDLDYPTLGLQSQVLQSSCQQPSEAYGDRACKGKWRRPV
ncbi:MAG: hypothetical protein EOO38_13870 [Cytophagaceae bacterium]|nr:MAG: hypothetical protein EOO38_13870 [Cytophagaceae bacterium]